MEMNIKHTLAASVLLTVGSVASAGYVQPAPVTISFTDSVASGDMWTARTSDNPSAFIGCGVRYEATGLTLAFCQAGVGPDEATQQIRCRTDNPLLADAIKAISAFSYISFSWDGAGNCTRIGVSSQSFYLPELKSKK
jgi:hypothetical protein